jgi:lipopolysaccharide/colanic/teichoic acid biosynthesis glycosyltransferase
LHFGTGIAPRHITGPSGHPAHRRRGPDGGDPVARPPLAYEVDRYEPWQHERLSVRPGITGLWQVSGRNRLSYLDMIRLDIVYAREWTFRKDLAIAVKTPWTMFVDRGGAE